MKIYRGRTNGRYPTGKRVFVFLRSMRGARWFFHLEVGSRIFGVRAVDPAIDG